MIGHVPLCAQHAAERYAEFPKQERMNSLRPYLAKYDLFPPRRDPQTVRCRVWDEPHPSLSDKPPNEGDPACASV